MEKSFPRSLIKSKRITLIKRSHDDSKEMFTLIDQNRDRLKNFLVWVNFVQKEEDQKNYIQITNDSWEEGTLFDFAIKHNESNRFIGSIGAHEIFFEHECAELGYWISEEFEGKGFISEAVTALETELFNLGFHRIEIRCNENNIKSANIPKRLGYTLEATLRENKIEFGKRRNTLVFAKLRQIKNPSRRMGFNIK